MNSRALPSGFIAIQFCGACSVRCLDFFDTVFAVPYVQYGRYVPSCRERIFSQFPGFLCCSTHRRPRATPSVASGSSRRQIVIGRKPGPRPPSPPPSPCLSSDSFLGAPSSPSLQSSEDPRSPVSRPSSPVAVVLSAAASPSSQSRYRTWQPHKCGMLLLT